MSVVIIPTVSSGLPIHALNLRFQLQTPHRHNLQIVREFIHVEQNKFCPCRFTPSHISLWENRLPCDSNVHPVATTYAVGCQHVADRFTCIRSYSFGCGDPTQQDSCPVGLPLPIPMPNIISRCRNKFQAPITHRIFTGVLRA